MPESTPSTAFKPDTAFMNAEFTIEQFLENLRLQATALGENYKERTTEKNKINVYIGVLEEIERSWKELDGGTIRTLILGAIRGKTISELLKNIPWTESIFNVFDKKTFDEAFVEKVLRGEVPEIKDEVDREFLKLLNSFIKELSNKWSNLKKTEGTLFWGMANKPNKIGAALMVAGKKDDFIKQKLNDVSARIENRVEEYDAANQKKEQKGSEENSVEPEIPEPLLAAAAVETPVEKPVTVLPDSVPEVEPSVSPATPVSPANITPQAPVADPPSEFVENSAGNTVNTVNQDVVLPVNQIEEKVDENRTEKKTGIKGILKQLSELKQLIEQEKKPPAISSKIPGPMMRFGVAKPIVPKSISFMLNIGAMAERDKKPLLLKDINTAVIEKINEYELLFKPEIVSGSQGGGYDEKRKSNISGYQAELASLKEALTETGIFSDLVQKISEHETLIVSKEAELLEREQKRIQEESARAEQDELAKQKEAERLKQEALEREKQEKIAKQEEAERLRQEEIARKKEAEEVRVKEEARAKEEKRLKEEAKIKEEARVKQEVAEIKKETDAKRASEQTTFSELAKVSIAERYELAGAKVSKNSRRVFVRKNSRKNDIDFLQNFIKTIGLKEKMTGYRRLQLLKGAIDYLADSMEKMDKMEKKNSPTSNEIGQFRKMLTKLKSELDEECKKNNVVFSDQKSAKCKELFENYVVENKKAMRKYNLGKKILKAQPSTQSDKLNSLTHALHFLQQKKAKTSDKASTAAPITPAARQSASKSQKSKPTEKTGKPFKPSRRGSLPKE